MSRHDGKARKTGSADATAKRAPRRPVDREMTIKRGADARDAETGTFGAHVPDTSAARTAFAAAAARAEARKRRQRKIALVAAGVVALALIAFGVTRFLPGGEQSDSGAGVQGFFDPNAKTGQAPNKTPEEIQAELDRIVEEGMFDISIASVIEFASPSSTGKAYIENVPGNRYDTAVSIRLDGTDEEVYASRGIAPGNFIEDIALTRELTPGNHTATATFTAYDRETHAEVGAAAAKVVLVIGGGDATAQGSGTEDADADKNDADTDDSGAADTQEETS